MNALNYNYIYNKKINICRESLDKNPYTWGYNYMPDVIKNVEYFCNLIQDGFNIIDVGAQSGSFSLAAKYFPNTRWKSFEADPTNYEILDKNISLNEIKNVKTYNFGVSNLNDTIEFNIVINHRGLNTFGFKNLETLGAIEKINVNVFKLDDIINDEINLIKIDTEGCELNILNGAKQKILKYKPKIFLEYYENHLLKFGHTLNDLHNFIEEINYKICDYVDENVLICPI